MIAKFSILKIIAIFILTTAIAAESLAQAPKPTANKSQESIAATIKALSTDWSTAMLKGDASILERIWATDFIYVEPNGKRFNKVEGIAGMKNSTEKLTSAVAGSIDVRVYGGGTVAVDIGDYKEVGTDKDGKPFERLSRFTNVWVLKEGKWQCVSGHASSVPVK
jgi:ketosteroid isomerase-like protein